jgi:general secretion pathway protein M
MSKFTHAFSNSGLGRWFYNREHNEQLIISGVAVLVLVAILWTVVWQPVADWRAQEVNRQQNAHQLLDWLKANEQAARQASRAPAQNQGGRALIPLITKAANAHDLKLNQLRPESNGVISVVLQQQSFNKIVSWIAQLEENNGIVVERASFDGQDAPGYVNAQIRLN